MKLLTKLMILILTTFFFVACGGGKEVSNEEGKEAETEEASEKEPAHKNEEITLGKEVEVYALKGATATLKIAQVTMDFFPEGKTVLLGDDKQVVRFNLEITNENSEEVFGLNFTNIRLNAGEEKDMTPTAIINKSNADDILESADLKKGDTATGALYFEIDKSLTMQDLVLVVKGYDANMDEKNTEIEMSVSSDEPSEEESTETEEETAE